MVVCSDTLFDSSCFLMYHVYMKIIWRKKSKTPEAILKRNIAIVHDYNRGMRVADIKTKYGFKDLRQIFNILKKMELINLPSGE